RQFHQRVVGHTHDPLARVAMHRAERVELFEKDVPESGFLFELAPRGFVERFIHSDEAARQRPFALERFEGALDQKHLEFAFIEISYWKLIRFSSAVSNN